jgi:citrate lyase gamma subunit
MRDVETSIEEEFSDNIETSVQETLKELNEKYDLNFEQIQVNDKNINSLKEATAHAIMTIKR